MHKQTKVKRRGSAKMNTATRKRQFFFFFFFMVSLCQILTYLCLLEISSALGFHPQGTRRRLSRRLSTVTEFRCTTWNPGAMPPRCLSLEETKPAWSSVMKKTPQPKVKNGTNSRRQLPSSLLPGVTEIGTVKLRLSTNCSGYFKSISSHERDLFQEIISITNDLTLSRQSWYILIIRILQCKFQKLPSKFMQQHLRNYFNSADLKGANIVLLF